MTDAFQSGLATAGLCASFGVGLVFLQAGLAKLRHRALLPGVIANYGLLPAVAVAPVAALLPFAELVLGAGLIGGSRLVVVPAAVLLIVFALAMELAMRRGRRHIDCGCGQSHLRQPLSRLLVARNLVLAALLMLRLGAAPASGLPVMALAAAGGLALFVLFLLFNGLAALAASPLSPGRR